MAFKEENGHFEVPLDRSLNHWASDQRKRFKEGKIRSDRKIKLEAIGFSCDPMNDSWNEQYLLLTKFHQQHAHVKVPFDSVHRSLYHWMVRQRMLYKQDKLSDFRILKLNELSFSWDSEAALWEEQCEN